MRTRVLQELLQDEKLQEQTLQNEEYRKNRYTAPIRDDNLADDSKESSTLFLPKRSSIVYPEKKLIRSLLPP